MLFTEKTKIKAVLHLGNTAFVPRKDSIRTLSEYRYPSCSDSGLSAGSCSDCSADSYSGYSADSCSDYPLL